MADDHADSDVPITLLADDDEKQELSKALLDRRQFNPNTADKGNTRWDTVLTTQIDAIAF